MSETEGRSLRLMVVGLPARYEEMKKSLNEIKEVTEVHYLSSGEEAINRYSDINPDMIFIDVTLENMTGIETGKQIREQMSSMKMVLVSESFDQEFLLAAHDAGMNGYMVRCADARVLLQVINEVNVGEFCFFFLV